MSEQNSLVERLRSSKLMMDNAYGGDLILSMERELKMRLDLKKHRWYELVKIIRLRQLVPCTHRTKHQVAAWNSFDVCFWVTLVMEQERDESKEQQYESLKSFISGRLGVRRNILVNVLWTILESMEHDNVFQFEQQQIRIMKDVTNPDKVTYMQENVQHFLDTIGFNQRNFLCDVLYEKITERVGQVKYLPKGSYLPTLIWFFRN